MTNPIGPSFADDLEAAGLGGLPITWSAAGDLNFGDGVTAKQRAAAAKALASHDPARPSRAAAIARLTALDAFIPRGLEDAWAATGFDTQALPQVQRDRLAEKAALRSRLAGR